MGVSGGISHLIFEQCRLDTMTCLMHVETTLCKKAKLSEAEGGLVDQIKQRRQNIVDLNDPLRRNDLTLFITQLEIVRNWIQPHVQNVLQLQMHAEAKQANAEKKKANKLYRGAGITVAPIGSPTDAALLHAGSGATLPPPGPPKTAEAVGTRTLDADTMSFITSAITSGFNALGGLRHRDGNPDFSGGRPGGRRPGVDAPRGTGGGAASHVAGSGAGGFGGARQRYIQAQQGTAIDTEAKAAAVGRSMRNDAALTEKAGRQYCTSCAFLDKFDEGARHRFKDCPNKHWQETALAYALRYPASLSTKY